MENYGPEIVKIETDVQNTERGISLFYIEVILMAIGLGGAFRSWWVFGGALVFFFVMAIVRPLAAILMFCLSAGEGWIVYTFAKEAWGLGAGVVLGILALLISGGLHQAAYKYLELEYFGPKKAHKPQARKESKQKAQNTVLESGKKVDSHPAAEVTIECPNCGQLNRLDPRNIHSSLCAACKSSLQTAERGNVSTDPTTVGSAGRQTTEIIIKCPECGQLNRLDSRRKEFSSCAACKISLKDVRVANNETAGNSGDFGDVFNMFFGDELQTTPPTRKCPTCNGFRTKPGTPSNVTTCSTCGGAGEQQPQVVQTSFGRMVNRLKCADCHGTGTNVEVPCPTCQGSGRVSAS